MDGGMDGWMNPSSTNKKMEVKNSLKTSTRLEFELRTDFIPLILASVYNTVNVS
jgi:hypothetical protein